MNLADETLNPWSREQLDEVLSLVGPLPADYRNFVITVGTGYITTQMMPDRDVTISEINSPLNVAYRSGFDAWIPTSYVPVASGTGGALAIRSTTGEVYFADYDKDVDLGLEDESSEEIMSRYADSWDSLINEMGSWEPPLD